MSASQRRKGHDWEREVARLFRAAMPGCEAKRGLSQTRGGTQECGDVELEHFTVECKVGKRPNVIAALEQACEHEESAKWPIAVVKVDRKTPLVAMRLEDFLELAGAWWAEVGKPHGVITTSTTCNLRVHPSGTIARADAVPFTITVGGKKR